MVPERLRQFLDAKDADYEVVPHPKGATKQVAKAVIVKVGEQDVMVVLPSTEKLDPSKLGVLLGDESISLENKEDIAGIFPDCDPEAVPALGTPYNLRCFVDETLLDGADVFIDDGNPKESIRMTSDEYWRVAQAEVGSFRKSEFFLPPQI